MTFLQSFKKNTLKSNLREKKITCLNVTLVKVKIPHTNST